MREKLQRCAVETARSKETLSFCLRAHCCNRPDSIRVLINLLSVNPTLIDVNETDKYAADGVNKLLVWKKFELSSKKAVSTGEMKELTDSLNTMLLEASAKNAHYVSEAFNMKARRASRQTRKPCKLQ